MSEKSPANVYAPHSHPGFFLALDGPDGAGKTTQINELANWLRSDGFDVVTCRDPGSTPVGDRLRGLVLDRSSVGISMRTEMLIYMASRAQLVDEVIRPALAAGRIVVSDRFLLASLVYQGFAGGLPQEEIWRVGQVATGGLLPDLTLVLDIPPGMGRTRSGGARDRIEDRPELYHDRVRGGFLEALSAQRTPGGCSYYRAPMVLIDASAEPQMVFNRIQREVTSALGLRSRT
jgi:dTMP kinase